MITISSRMQIMLKNLLYKDIDNYNQLISILKITIRQADYDIQKINELFENSNEVIKVMPDGKLILDKERLRLILFNRQTKYTYTQDQYMQLLEVILMFNIQSLNLNMLSKEFNVSRMTFVNCMKKIKNKLNDFNICIEYDKYYYLVADEVSLFNYRHLLLKQLIGIYYKVELNYLEHKIIFCLAQSTHNIQLPDVHWILNRFMNENQLIIKDDDCDFLEISILLILWYNINHKNIPDNIDIFKNDVHIEDYLVYEKFFEKWEKIYDLSFSLLEKDKVISLFENVGIKTIYLKGFFSKDIIIFIFQLVIFLEESTNYIFHNDVKLLNGLYRHLYRNCRKYINKFSCEDNINYDIDGNEDVLKQIEIFCNNISDMRLINVDNKFFIDEIPYLQLYFLESIYRNKPFPKKKVVLVSDIRYFARLQLQYNLKAHFEIELDNIARMSIPYYHKWNEVDLALFTEDIPLEFYECPSLKVNLYLTPEDYNNILRKGINLRKLSIDFYPVYTYLLDNKVGFLDFAFFSEDKFLHSNDVKYEKYDLLWEKIKIEDYDWNLWKFFYVSFIYNKDENITTFYIDSLNENKIYIKFQAIDFFQLFTQIFQFYSWFTILNIKTIEECICFLNKYK